LLNDKHVHVPIGRRHDPIPLLPFWDGVRLVRARGARHPPRRRQEPQPTRATPTSPHLSLRSRTSTNTTPWIFQVELLNGGSGPRPTKSYDNAHDVRRGRVNRVRRPRRRRDRANRPRATLRNARFVFMTSSALSLTYLLVGASAFSRDIRSTRGSLLSSRSFARSTTRWRFVRR